MVSNLCITGSAPRLLGGPAHLEEHTMYGMVLMVAVTGSGDTASFGKRGGGCNGDVVAGCDGGGHHFRGGCHGGFLGGRRGGNGCSGASAGCTGTVAGCTGTVVAAPAPVVAAPAPVAAAPCAPACDPCAAPACDPCAKKRGGLFSRLCGKHKNKGCDTCATAAPACSPCATGAAVVVPAAPVPVAMPPVTGKQ